MQDSVCLSLVAGYPAKRKYKAVRGRMPNRGLASGKSCHRHSQGRMGQAAAAGSNVRMLQWGNCQSVVQQAGMLEFDFIGPFYRRCWC